MHFKSIKMKKIENKKKKIVLVLIILLILLLLVVLIVGKTYSKYSSALWTRVESPVARWSFLVNGKEGTLSNIQLNSTYDKDTLVNGKIAPGTKGSFDIEIDARGSEVGIEYCVKFYNISNEPENMTYSYEGNKVQTLQELQELIKGRIGVDDETKQRMITINWQWDYQTGNSDDEMSVADQIDTNNSKQMPNFAFDIYVIGNQERPLE